MEEVRAQEASAIRSHLQQEHSDCVRETSSSSSPPTTTTSWAVEHHPLSLSRYQREFRQIRLLNAGSFGQVFQATHKMDGKDYAIKRVVFGATGYKSDTITQAIREVQCLAQCDHPNCVRYYTSWLEPSWMTGSSSATRNASDRHEDGGGRRPKLLTMGQTNTSTSKVSGSGLSRRFSFAGHAHHAAINDTSWASNYGDDYDDSSYSCDWSSLPQSQDDLQVGRAPPRIGEGGVRDHHRPSYRYEICLFIQMQLCHPTTLADWIRQRNLRSMTTIETRLGPAMDIFQQICSGIAHIHERGILHRDLKPSNVFATSDGRFKIGDFGLSRLLRDGGGLPCPTSGGQQEEQVSLAALVLALPKTNPLTDSSDGLWTDPLTAGVGTASYCAPEQLESRTYGKEADVFSMGLILLELLCCFRTEHERIHTFSDCRKRQKLPPWLAQHSSDVASIILSCTEPDPLKRLTANDLLDETMPKNRALSHTNRTGVLQSQLEKKDQELQRQRSEIEEKDRIIHDLRRQVQRMSSFGMPSERDTDEVTNVDFDRTKAGIVEPASQGDQADCKTPI